jgi:hypothetical protein
MSYTPTEWKAGDTVTSAKLNKLEQGVASSGGTDILFVTATYDDVEQTYTLNKTWTEIYNANVAIITFTDTDMKGIALVTEIEHTGEGYAVQDVNGTTYIADSANGYPASDGGK